jgi:hypothetical protein
MLRLCLLQFSLLYPIVAIELLRSSCLCSRHLATVVLLPFISWPCGMPQYTFLTRRLFQLLYPKIMYPPTVFTVTQPTNPQYWKTGPWKLSEIKHFEYTTGIFSTLGSPLAWRYRQQVFSWNFVTYLPDYTALNWVGIAIMLHCCFYDFRFSRFCFLQLKQWHNWATNNTSFQALRNSSLNCHPTVR